MIKSLIEQHYNVEVVNPDELVMLLFPEYLAGTSAAIAWPRVSLKNLPKSVEEFLTIGTGQVHPYCAGRRLFAEWR